MTLPDPELAKFKVGNTQLDGFEYQDTRHGVQPGRPSVGVNYFPGSDRPFVMKGAGRQSTLPITGVLRADSFTLMHELIEQHRAWVAQTHQTTVTIHDKTYVVAPLFFEVLDPYPLAYKIDQGTEDPAGARIRARFIFQVLA
jgi:hypothetical protein